MNRAGGSLFARDGTTTASRYLDSYLMRMRLDRILPIVLITEQFQILFHIFHIKKKEREKEKKKKEVKTSQRDKSKTIDRYYPSFVASFFNNMLSSKRRKKVITLNASTDYRDSLALSLNEKVNQKFFSADNSRRYVCFLRDRFNGNNNRIR